MRLYEVTWVTGEEENKVVQVNAQVRAESDKRAEDISFDLLPKTGEWEHTETRRID